MMDRGKIWNIYDRFMLMGYCRIKYITRVLLLGRYVDIGRENRISRKQIHVSAGFVRRVYEGWSSTCILNHFARNAEIWQKETVSWTNNLNQRVLARTAEWNRTQTGQQALLDRKSSAEQDHLSNAEQQDHVLLGITKHCAFCPKQSKWCSF